MNGLLDLTPREIDILTTLIKIDLAWIPRNPSEIKNLLSTDNRRITMKENNMNKSNFAKIIGKLQSMGLLIASQEGGMIINELLKPILNKNNKVEVAFTLDLNDAIQQAV